MRKLKKKSAAVAIDEPSGLGGFISAHPREFVGVLFGSAAIVTIFVNALFMQKGPHPAPIFATRSAPVVAAPAAQPMPAAGPAVSTPILNRVQLIVEIQRALSRRGFYDGTADGIWGAKTDSGARDFAQAAGIRIGPEPSEELLRALTASTLRPPAPTRRDPIAELIAPSQRVLAIQRALSDFGYGQIKPTGTYDPDTRTAIEKFERDRRLPVTGQISDRFVRELAAMTGRPLE